MVRFGIVSAKTVCPFRCRKPESKDRDFNDRSKQFRVILNTINLETQVRGAFLAIDHRPEILTIALEVNSYGAILVAERHEIPVDAVLATIRYCGEERLARIVDSQIEEEKYLRLKLVWEEKSNASEIKRHVIFVRPGAFDSDLSIILEQVRDDGQTNIEMTEEELQQVVESLSVVGRPLEDLRLELASGLEIYRFKQDGSFVINRNDEIIFGVGDIRFYLHPV